jgi:hypothetical protein
MPVLTMDDAVELMMDKLGSLGCEDVLYIYNELFPDERATEDEVHEDETPLIEGIEILARSGSDPKFVIELWDLTCREDGSLSYDEDEQRFHYGDDAGEESVE